MSKGTQPSAMTGTTAVASSSRESTILVKSQQWVQSLGPSSFVTRSTEVTSSPQSHEVTIDHIVSEVYISASRTKAEPPHMPDVPEEGFVDYSTFTLAAAIADNIFIEALSLSNKPNPFYPFLSCPRLRHRPNPDALHHRVRRTGITTTKRPIRTDGNHQMIGNASLSGRLLCSSHIQKARHLLRDLTRIALCSQIRLRFNERYG
jgi:hypothetical protein